MSTGCVRSRSKTAEHRLNKQEHPYFRRKLSIVGSMLKHWMHQSETTKDVTDDEDTEMDSQKLRSSEDNQQDELGQKKPRRKDTPVLNSPPLIPGVRLMKGETRLIHFEDEEKETKK